ncbi:MAG: HEAT-like repeat-containing protein [Deltaproteobacteria bacterium]|nr:HEAT-like repeat-containing protein [Deltaproteobacteria bacterium]
MPGFLADILPAAAALNGKSVEELLLLVADDDQGLKPAAMERLLAMEFEALYPILESGVRNDTNADLRSSSMEVLVKLGRQCLPRLLKLLLDPDEEVRNFAAVMLGDIGNRQAVGPLIQTLRDKDLNVSHGAAEALGKIGDRAALLPLLELLQGDFWLQYAAITAIGAMRDYRAVPHLLNLLDHDLLAEPVIQTLGKIGDPRALYPLCNLLSVTSDALADLVAIALVEISRNVNETLKFKNSLAEFSQPGQLRHLITGKGVRRLHAILDRSTESAPVEAAVTLLGWVGDNAALAQFYRLLDNPYYMPVIESAIFSLGTSAAGSLMTALEHANDTVRIVAIRSLRRLGERIDDRVLAGLITSPNDAVQIEALETLKNCPAEEMLLALATLLLHDNHEISSRAAEALGNFPLSMIQPFLDFIMHSSEAVIRKRAARLLGYLPHGGGAELLAMLAADNEPEVRCEALLSVGEQQVKAALPLLRQALADPEAAVREAAVMALAEFGVPNCTAELLALLDAGDERLRYAVIKTLGMMAATETGPALMGYLQNAPLPGNIEYAIIETLGKTGCSAASGMISSRYLQHPDPDIRRLAVETLGALGDRQSLAGVASAAKDAHWSVRIAALDVLGRSGGARELPLLLAAMADRDSLVRKHAILALGDLHDISTVTALAQQLVDMEMSRYAFEALLKFGKAALPWLHRLMTGDDPLELRLRVIDLIGKIADSKSIAPLLTALDDDSPDIRLAAIDSLAFCFDSLPLKKLAGIRKNDRSAEVKERAGLALKTFMMEKYL